MQQFLTAIAFLYIFSSCKDDSENNLAVFRAINEGLLQSNDEISRSNELIYRSIEESLADPQTSEGMKFWQPKAIKIKEFSDSMLNYIKGLKEELVSEAGPAKPGDKEAFERNPTVTDHLFESHGKGKALFEKLVNYKRDVLSVDPKLNNTFKDNVTIFTKEFDQNENGAKEFSKIFFSKIPAIAAMAMLSKFENNVKITENHLINYCNSQMCVLNIIYDSFAPLVSLSSSYVKAGDKIEITAGIGAFFSAPNPKISISNIAIPINENGVAIYNFKTPLKAGKYFVPVKIDFITVDGRKESFEKRIEYTVKE